mgnify:CR=1 FL=1
MNDVVMDEMSLAITDESDSAKQITYFACNSTILNCLMVELQPAMPGLVKSPDYHKTMVFDSNQRDKLPA